jgi:hypothetical protein
MNTLKTVYGKLFKEETKLASHEVELAITDDIKKIMQTAVNNKNSYSSEALRAVDQIKKAKNIGLEWRDNLQKAQQKIIELTNSAKALGLDIPKEIIAYQEVVSKGIKDVSSYTSKLNELQNQIPLD